VIGFAQTCPTPSTSGAHIMLDSTYQTGTYRSGKTNIGLCFYNNTSTKITAVQYRVFYDNAAFAKVDTVTSMNTSFAQDLQYVDNAAAGYVTITMVYTGTNSSFTIPDGRLFQVTLKHTTALSTTYFSVTDMKFTGTASFPETATSQAGLDYTLTLKNFGGKFKPQVMSFKGKFVNVTGTPSKNLSVSLEKKLKSSSSWSYVQTSVTNTQGRFNFTNVEIDTTAWDVRIAVKGDTMGVGAIVSTADAQRANKFVLGTLTPSGFDFYSTDVNNDDKITVSDVYGIYARVSGRFGSWANSRKDILFFTDVEYGKINGATSSQQSSIAGVTNFTFQIIAGQPDSVTYYVLGMGDVNGTGYNRARMTPIEIVNPNNANKHIIDVTTQYDNILETIEVNLPVLKVDDGNLVNIPVKLKTGGVKVGALQLMIKYDTSLLEFKSVKNELKSSLWLSYINTSENKVEWGGYDPTNNVNLFDDNELIYTLQFSAKKPQSQWGMSPLYVTRKFAGNKDAIDLNITPTDGIVQVFKVGGHVYVGKDMELYPNPFTSSLSISFNVKQQGNTTLSIVDVTGREVKTVMSDMTPSGKYTYTVDMSDLSDGMYLAVLKKEEEVQVKRAVKTN
jgi:hypothetical protein